MAVDDFAAFNRKLDRFRDQLDGRQLQAALDAIGKAAKEDAAEAVRSDLGDQSMSHWRRSRPIQIVARYDFPSDHEISVTPAPRARGPFTVLEEGRRAGVSKGRRGRAGRPVSASTGKQTWTEAAALMDRRTPDRVDKYVVKAAIRKADL